MIADVSKLVPWSVLWDLALNNGPNFVKALYAFIQITASISIALKSIVLYL